MKKKMPVVTVAFGKNNWIVKKSTNATPYCSCEKKSTALKFAKKYAKKLKAELYIYKKSGSIQARHTYGKDPYPPKG